DLMSYLFGNVLMISRQDLLFIAALDGLILLFFLLFNRQLLLLCFDAEFAAIRGIRVDLLQTLLLCLVALTVVLLIQLVGLILVIALLCLPAASARLFSRSLHGMMLRATLIGALTLVAGLALSFQADLPAGAVIALLCGLVYLLSLVAQRLLGRSTA
ncbi:MAG: metal ABC transporter permease, partial [Desulfuromonas thiophila]|nr:metal ABC transporter permease [Desulfuromonas thiophila]